MQWKRLVLAMLCEIIYNDESQPVDYLFLEVNPAFEHMTELKAKFVLGSSVQDVLPQTESRWIDKFGKVAQDEDLQAILAA